MTPIARTDRSLIGQWFWTVDHWLILAVILLLVSGAILTSAASPSVAVRMKVDDFHFLRRQFVFLPVAVALVIGLSLLSRRQVTAFCLGLLAVSFVLTTATLVLGSGPDGLVKGAARWIRLGGFSLQPSELMKPAVVIVTAWLFWLRAREPNVPGLAIALGMVLTVAALLIRQPDLGMTMLVLAAFIIQLYLAGMPLYFVMIPCGALIALLGIAYLVFDHVAQRIDRFLAPAAGNEHDQIWFSLHSFANGGWTGTGPGDGRFKLHLPDAHSDFIFAVAGEEFGFLGCAILVLLLSFVVVRGLVRLARQDDLFVTVAAGGLLAQFGLQALINMASTVALIPTKGMTLPFISYGGSSLLSVAITMGLVLALTRRSAAEDLAASPAMSPGMAGGRA